jgi:PhnB protein
MADAGIENPPAGMARITPYLLYEDVDGAVAFLTGAFGFRQRVRIPGPEGKTVHAEITLEDGVVMMGYSGPDYRSPKSRGGVTQEVYVYVDDVDAHCAAAQAYGAEVIRPLADQFYGDRTYAAADPEGHQWSFAQHVRAMDPGGMPS